MRNRRIGAKLHDFLVAMDNEEYRSNIIKVLNKAMLIEIENLEFWEIDRGIKLSTMFCDRLAPLSLLRMFGEIIMEIEEQS